MNLEENQIKLKEKMMRVIISQWKKTIDQGSFIIIFYIFTEIIKNFHSDKKEKSMLILIYTIYSVVKNSRLMIPSNLYELVTLRNNT